MNANGVEAPKKVLRRALVRQLREQRGLTTTGLSLQLGKSHSYISRLETGGIDDPPRSLVERLGSLLEVNADYLLGEPGEEDWLPVEPLPGALIPEMEHMRQEIATLPPSEQEHLYRLIKTFLDKPGPNVP